MTSLLFEISLYAVVSFGALLMLGSSTYDIQASSRRKRTKQITPPHSTVLVYAHNNATTIRACLESIVENKLPGYDVVVVDALSCDDTSRVVRMYRRAHPEVPLRLYAKRVMVDRTTALRQAYYRSQRGAVVFTLNGDHRMSKSSMRVTALFSQNESLQAIQLPVLVRPAPRLSSTIAYFLCQSRSIYLKATSLVRRHTAIDFGHNGGVYRVRAYESRRVLPARYAAYRYESAYGAVEALHGGLGIIRQLNNKRLQPWYQKIAIALILIWLSVLCVWTMQLAATLQTSAPLVLSWLLAVLWLITITIADEHTRFTEKIAYIFSTPILVLCLYVYISIRYLVSALLRSVGWVQAVAAHYTQAYR